MPFGQSFFISRIVGGVVEAVTGDKEKARTARNITRVALLIGTLDIGGHLLESALDHGSDVATDHLTDTAVDHATDAGANHLSPKFGWTASDVTYDHPSDMIAGLGVDKDGNPVDNYGYRR